MTVMTDDSIIPQLHRKTMPYLPIYYCMFLNNGQDNESVILPELEPVM